MRNTLSIGSIATLIKFEFRRRLFSLAFIISTALPIASVVMGIAFAKSDSPQETVSPNVVSFDSTFTVSQTTIDTLNMVLQMAQKSNSEVDVALQQQEIEESKQSVNKLVTTALTLMIYLFLILYGIQILQCVLEEKTNRMAEILLTAISPIKLLFGKIVAIGLVGLLQIAVWLSMVWVFIKYQELDTSAGINQLMNLPAGFAWSDLPILSPLSILFLVLLFIGGYLFYSSLFTCLGVSIDGVTDSSQSSILVIAPLILSIFVSMEAINGESGIMLDICTYLPFTSPIVLLVQVGNGLPIWKAVIALFILLISTYFMLKMAVKVYKRGMIHYGGKVTLKQMIQWIKK